MDVRRGVDITLNLYPDNCRVKVSARRASKDVEIPQIDPSLAFTF